MLVKLALVLSLALLFPAFAAAGCIPPEQARNHVGETKCVIGKVIGVAQDRDGVYILGFCEDPAACRFIAVIFPEDLRHIGDIRKLRGKSIEVHGEVMEYSGEAEIIVSESRQLRGEAASIPPLPKKYDVEEKGHYSPGLFSHPKTYSTTKKRQPAKLPMEIPDDPEE